MRRDLPSTGRRLPVVVAYLFATGVFASALAVAPVVGGAINGLAPVLAAVVISAVSVAYGMVLSPWLAVPATAPRLLVWAIVGYAGASAVHLSATAVLNVGATAALGVDVVVALALFLVRWGTRSSTLQDCDATPLRSWFLEAGVMLGCAGLVAFWARQTIAVVPHVEATGIFSAWQDYFLHAAEITYLRDYPSFGQHSQYLSAIPQPLYHRGSYALAALFSQLGHVPSIVAATVYWLPTGLLLSMLATYALGAVLGGPLGGIGAVGAVFLLPDASSYGLENRYLSFHWLVQMAAGSGYALAPVVLAVTALASSPAAPGVAAFVTAAVLVAVSAAFRVHVALLASAMLAWLLVLSFRPRLSGRLAGGIAAMVAVAAVALTWMESLQLAPHFMTGVSHPVVFFKAVHTQGVTTASAFTDWSARLGNTGAVLVGFAMMLVAGCGLPLLAAVLLGLAGVLRRVGRLVAQVIAAVLLASLSVIVVVPTPAHGDVTDLGHRPFVLVYLLVSAFAGIGTVRLLTDWAARRPSRRASPAWIVATLTVCGLFVPWHIGRTVQQRWMPAYALIALDPDVLEAARFVRRHAEAGEQILASSEDPQGAIVAFSERRAYLSRMPLFQLLGGDALKEATARAGLHASLLRSESFDAMRAVAKGAGVAWYIADTPIAAAWATALPSRSAFASGHVRVYDLR